MVFKAEDAEREREKLRARRQELQRSADEETGAAEKKVFSVEKELNTTATPAPPAVFRQEAPKPADPPTVTAEPAVLPRPQQITEKETPPVEDIETRRARKEEKQWRNTLLTVFEWLESILFALVLVMAIFTFVFKTYTVDGDSMLPTLHTGDYIFAYSLMYTPQQGDIVIIDSSNNYGRPLIKRVVAVSGQLLEVDETGTIYVDGQVFSYDGKNLNNLNGDVQYPLVVPDGYVFVMGDNRATSLDSRYERVGFIDVRSIVGKEIFVMGE